MTPTIFVVAFINYLTIIAAVVSDSVTLAIIAAVGSAITAVCTALGGYWAYKAKVASGQALAQTATNHVENQTLLKSIDSNVNGKMDKLMDERDKALGVTAGSGGTDK